MNSTHKIAFLGLGLLSCMTLQPAAAQVVHETDSLRLFSNAHGQVTAEADILPVGHCFSHEAGCDACCDDGCGSQVSSPSCDAIGCCSCGRGKSKCQCCKCREKLFGDACGYRSCFAEHGIAYEGFFSQYYQGVASGGEQRTFRYGAKLDNYYAFSSEKMGLWKGGALSMHTETNLGENSIFDVAGLAPANTAFLTPTLDDYPVYAITNFQFEQELGHGYAATFGRFNFIDLWAAFYPDYGKGRDGFMNTSSIVFLNVVPTLPLIFNGAGLIKAGKNGIEGVVMVLDPDNVPTVTGLDELFADGSTILGAYRIFTEFGGLPGSHLVAGTYETRTIQTFEEKGWLAFPPGVPAIPLLEEQTGSWLGAYVGRQTLWQDRCDKNRSVWFMTTMGWADRKTSPFEWMGTYSIEAVGLNKNRKNDRMGISYFYSDVSDDLESLANGSPLNLDIQDLQGGEFYYNAEINPWFHLTGDIQVIETENASQDTAFVLGARAVIDL